MKSTQSKLYDQALILNCMKGKDAFAREDEKPDKEFYKVDRFVEHLDDQALETVKNLFAQLITEKNPVILDLMAGWDSHLPEKIRPARVYGLGMNKNELEKNPALDEYLVHDLNLEPRLPYQDQTFDVVINTVSVDYLVKPFEVFREVGRVLKPGGLFLVVFSNRFFPQKAVKVWREATEDERIDLVKEYFAGAGAFTKPEVFISMGKPRPQDDKYAFLGVPSDPVFAVYAEKKGGSKFKRRTNPAIDREKPLDPAELKKRKQQIKRSLRCPYCKEKMKKWAVPDDPFVEWDNQYMYICFNDACPYLVRGWKAMFDQGIPGTSYRLMYNPDRDRTLCAPVHGLNDLKDSIVED